VRGVGLGRWLVKESVRYTREVGFDSVYLWTVAGLGRAIAIYELVEFIRTAKRSWRHGAKTVSRYALI
jgi:GNAT superfamily N-acetyltransferase